MSDNELLDQIRENLDYFVDYYDKHVEPTAYEAGRKSAFEDIARMIDNYRKGSEEQL